MAFRVALSGDDPDVAHTQMMDHVAALTPFHRSITQLQHGLESVQTSSRNGVERHLPCARLAGARTNPLQIPGDRFAIGFTNQAHDDDGLLVALLACHPSP